MLATILTLVTLSSSPAATEIVLARFNAVGLDDAHLKRAQKKLKSEVESADATLVKPLTAVDETCVGSPECMQGAIGPHRGAVTVDILRIGPMVTITAELYDASGARIAGVDQTTDTTAFDDTGVLLGTDILDPIRALAPPVEVTPMEPKESAADPAATHATTGSTSGGPSPSSSSAGSNEAFPVLPTAFMVGGGAVLAVGLAIGIVSLVGIVSQAQVLQTPTTTTAEKDLAITLGRAALAGAALGVVGAGIGGGVAAVGLFVE